MTNAIVLSVFALLFGVVRFFIPTHGLSAHGSYEAFAHLFVGGLFGAWMASRKSLYLTLALIMTAVEVVAFFTMK